MSLFIHSFKHKKNNINNTLIIVYRCLSPAGGMLFGVIGLLLLLIVYR